MIIPYFDHISSLISWLLTRKKRWVKPLTKFARCNVFFQAPWFQLKRILMALKVTWVLFDMYIIILLCVCFHRERTEPIEKVELGQSLEQLPAYVYLYEKHPKTLHLLMFSFWILVSLQDSRWPSTFAFAESGLIFAPYWHHPIEHNFYRIAFWIPNWRSNRWHRVTSINV